VFPVRYELDVYILFGRNSVFKWLTCLLYKGRLCLRPVCESSYSNVIHKSNFLTFDIYIMYCFSIGIRAGFALDGQGSIAGRGDKFFSSPQRPDRLWAQPPSYTMDTGSSFPGGKAAGARR
jgi:hypothetical protein